MNLLIFFLLFISLLRSIVTNTARSTLVSLIIFFGFLTNKHLKETCRNIKKKNKKTTHTKKSSDFHLKEIVSFSVVHNFPSVTI